MNGKDLSEKGVDKDEGDEGKELGVQHENAGASRQEDPEVGETL